MTGANDPWDRFRIKAEIQRQGYTLTQIAQEAGLAESACRMALTGHSRAGAEAIARFLGKPLTVLFPGLYLRVRSIQPKAIAKPAAESRKKRVAAADTARART